METGEAIKPLRIIKIIQALLMLAVLIYADILLRLPIPPIFNTNSDTLRLIIFVLIVLGCGSLVYSYFMPRLMIKGYRGYKRIPKPNGKSQIFSIFLVRASMYESVAIYGLILGILGAKLEIVVPFFIVSLICLAITFPTKNKWEKLATMIGSQASK